MNYLTAPVYDLAKVARLLRISYTPEEMAGFGPLPDPHAGFVTLFDPGWSFLKLRAALGRAPHLFYELNGHEAEPFALVEDVPRYRQVRLEPVPMSFGKRYDDQVFLLPVGEEVPPARVVIIAATIHFLATSVRMYEASWVRCADLKPPCPCRHITVCDFGTKGLAIGSQCDDLERSVLGLASQRKD